MELGESWGPATWYILHSISFSWDERFINDYRRFFNLIAQTIPCQKCKNHFSRSINRQNWLIRNNVTSKESMTKWLIDIHNDVNRRNRKKIISYDRARNIYLNKEGNVKYRRQQYYTFMREYIFYNFKFQFLKSLEILKLLGKIFPHVNKRRRLMKFIKNRPNIKKFGLIKWLKRYKNILA